MFYNTVNSQRDGELDSRLCHGWFLGLPSRDVLLGSDWAVNQSVAAATWDFRYKDHPYLLFRAAVI